MLTNNRFKLSITYRYEKKLVVLLAGYEKMEIVSSLKQICEKNEIILAGLGSTVNSMQQIHTSFEKAGIACQLAQTAEKKQLLDYEELGVYKIISEVKEQPICDAFVEEVLGKLMLYDKENKVPLLPVLEAYFGNECSIVQTAEALFFHVNTMKYKLSKIKEVLGYDILLNENRMKIMLAFYILRAKQKP